MLFLFLHYMCTCYIM